MGTGTRTWTGASWGRPAEARVRPRCDISRVLSPASTLGMEVRHRLTSVAQAANPDLYRSSEAEGGARVSIWCLRSFLRCFTVNSSTSAFSSLEMDSPSVCRACTIKSFSSSRHLLILARLFLSSIGFITFRY